MIGCDPCCETEYLGIHETFVATHKNFPLAILIHISFRCSYVSQFTDRPETGSYYFTFLIVTSFL